MCRKIAVVELTAVVTFMASIQSGMCGKKNAETLLRVSFSFPDLSSIFLLSVFLFAIILIFGALCFREEMRSRFIVLIEEEEVLKCLE